MRRFFSIGGTAAVVVPARDELGERVHAAIAADEAAILTNAQSYEARVESMIVDFFAKYGDRGARHHP